MNAPLPATPGLVTSIVAEARDQLASQIDHVRPVAGLLGLSARLADHLRARLADRWPTSQLRTLGNAQPSLEDMWVVCTNEASAGGITGPLFDAAPLAQLVIIGAPRRAPVYLQQAHVLLDTETAIDRVVDLITALATHRELAGQALIEQRTAARLAAHMSSEEIRRLGFDPGSAAAPSTVEEEERAALRRVLIEANGNRTKAAKLFRVSRRTFYRLLERHGLE